MFQVRIKEASATLILLSSEFERLEVDYADLLSEGYPFSVCLREVVHSMLEWQDTTNNRLEAIKRETDSANS